MRLIFNGKETKYNAIQGNQWQSNKVQGNTMATKSMTIQSRQWKSKKKKSMYNSKAKKTPPTKNNAIQ